MPIQITPETLIQAARRHLGLTFTIQGDQASVPISELLRVVLGVVPEISEAPTEAPEDLEAKVHKALETLQQNPLFSHHSPRELETQVRMVFGGSEKDIAKQLGLARSTVQSYGSKLLLSRPATEVIREVLDGKTPLKKETRWRPRADQARKRILELLQIHPRGLTSPEISKKINEAPDFVRCLLGRLVTAGDLVRNASYYQTVWTLVGQPKRKSPATVPDLVELSPQEKQAKIRDTDAKIERINKALNRDIPVSNAGRSLVLDAQGNSRRAIAKILGLSEISVGVYCRQLRKELGKLTIAEEILSVLASE